VNQSSKRRLAIASDHAGYALKEYLKQALPEITWEDEGPFSEERTDYPDYAAKVANKVAQGNPSLGVLVCGSGIGMCIAANKAHGIRAAVVESEQTARLSRAHNDSNILCLGARILSQDYAKQIITAWLETPFEGGRHADRVNKITQLENRPHAKPSRSTENK